MTHPIDRKPQPDAIATERGWEIPLKGTNPDDNLMEVIVAIDQLATKIEDANPEPSFPDDPLIDNFEPDDWGQNRGLPHSFGPITLEDGNKVLQLEIAGDDQDENDFYNWQGKEHYLIAPNDGVVIPSFVQFKMFIDPAWQDVPGEMLPSIWLTVLEPNNNRRFPMCGPYFVDGDFQMWYNNGVSTPEATTHLPTFGEWATVKIVVVEGGWRVYIDDVQVVNRNGAGYAAGTKIESMIFFAYNGGNDYSMLIDEITFGQEE